MNNNSIPIILLPNEELQWIYDGDDIVGYTIIKNGHCLTHIAKDGRRYNKDDFTILAVRQSVS